MSDDHFQTRWQGHSTDDNPFAAQATEASSLPMRTRRSLGETFGGDRDLYDTLGYDEQLSVEDYWDRYLRQDLARTIVDAPAKTTWREQPKVVDDDNDEQQTAFERDVETLFREHELQSRLDAVDRLAGIGHFGLLVIGVKDDTELSEPVQDGRLSSPDDLAYLMPVAEDRVEEWELVEDETDERFGLPEQYSIDFSKRDRSQLGTSISFSQHEIRDVHHSRVIHVPASNTLDNVLMGRPRLEAVYNRLQDLEKVIGASSEMFWRAADYGLALQSDPEHAGKLNKEAKENLEEELQKWYHGMQPFLRLSGFDVEKLGGEEADPTGVVEQLLKLVAGETGIPQRILTGSERGELASTQDRASWLGRISERQTNFAEPRILRALIDRLVTFGILSTPTGDDDDQPEGGRDYEVEWPNLFELSDVEKAEIAAKKAQALNRARNKAAGQQIMTPGEVRSEIFDMDPELGSEVDIEEGEGEDDPLADLLPPDQQDPPEEGAEPPTDEGDAPADAPPDGEEQSNVLDAITDGGPTVDT